MLRTMLLAVALVMFASAQQTISFPAEYGESAPTFMGKTQLRE